MQIVEKHWYIDQPAGQSYAYKPMNLVFLFVLAFIEVICFAKNVSTVDDVDIRNYSELNKRCNGNSCCEASAKRLEKSNGFLIRPNQPFECPEGFQANGLKCLDSYRWCEPKSK